MIQQKSVWYFPRHFIILIYDVNACGMKSPARSTRPHALGCACRAGECSASPYPNPSNQIPCNDQDSAMVCGLRPRVLQALPEVRFLTLPPLSPALRNWDSQLLTQMSSLGSLGSWLALKYDTCFTSCQVWEDLSIWSSFCILLKGYVFWNDYIYSYGTIIFC